jgi:hypothetical protein
MGGGRYGFITGELGTKNKKENSKELSLSV